MSPTPLTGPVPLEKATRSPISIVAAPLNDFLNKLRLAKPAESLGANVCPLRGDQVVGYYSLAAASFQHQRQHPRGEGLTRHPVPVILLARLAVDQSEKRGLSRRSS
jgi:hypothetical protein